MHSKPGVQTMKENVQLKWVIIQDHNMGRIFQVGQFPVWVNIKYKLGIGFPHTWTT